MPSRGWNWGFLVPKLHASNFLVSLFDLSCCSFPDTLPAVSISSRCTYSHLIQHVLRRLLEHLLHYLVSSEPDIAYMRSRWADSSFNMYPSDVFLSTGPDSFIFRLSGTYPGESFVLIGLHSSLVVHFEVLSFISDPPTSAVSGFTPESRQNLLTYLNLID